MPTTEKLTDKCIKTNCLAKAQANTFDLHVVFPHNTELHSASQHVRGSKILVVDASLLIAHNQCPETGLDP